MRRRSALGHVWAAAIAGAAVCSVGGVGGACGPVVAPREAAEAPSRAATIETAPAAARDPAPAPGDPLAGTWWVFMPDRPYVAFRLSLESSQGGDITGSWKSFDWLASRSADELRRLSKGVTVTGETEEGVLRLAAPMPMLDWNGSPNGQRGSWRLDLKEANLAGEPLRFSGHAISAELEDPAGVPVTLEREFRSWKP